MSTDNKKPTQESEGYNTENDSSQIIEYLEKFEDKAWDCFIYHKDQIQKLCFWNAGLLITILGATQLLGSMTQSDKQKQLEQVITSGYFVFSVIAILYAMLLFIFHHRLAAKFYMSMLTHCSAKYESLTLNRKYQHQIKGPYFLYKSIYLHKKRPLGFFVGRVSFFGTWAVFIFIVLISFLVFYLLYGYFEHTFPTEIYGKKNISSSIFSALGLLFLVAVTNGYFDILHSRYYALLKQSFQKIEVK